MKASIVFSLVILSATSTIAAIDKVILYADSYSDSGNDYKNSEFPSSPPYWKGRFSNGPTWAEYVAKSISIPFSNNGYGGATTNNKDVYSKSNDYNALVEYGLKKNRHGADLKFIDSHACFVKRLSYPEAKVHKAWGDMAIMPLEHVYNIN